MESTDPQLSPEKPIGGEDWRYLKGRSKGPKGAWRIGIFW